MKNLDDYYCTVCESARCSLTEACADSKISIKETCTQNHLLFITIVVRYSDRNYTRHYSLYDVKCFL